jgi:flagellar biosynthesis protein FliP
VTPELGPWLVLGALPILLAVATAFTKASIVLGALRVGLGAEVLLPWAAMWGLALVITAVVMGPVALEMLAVIEAAGGAGALSKAGIEAWVPVATPLLEFLGRHAAPDEVRFFAELQGVDGADPRVLVPSFLVTELGEALHMAVLILLPLVLVDLVVAQALTLLGLAAAPGPLVTLPLKLLLFLAVGGFDVVVRGLVEGYA